jgi:Arc/MetJ-type ribon-helix-helix transcriptional regulator
MKLMRAISIKLPDPLERKLDALAKARGQNRSEVIRDAIEAFADGPEKPSTLDAIGHLVGCLDDDGPADLATNPEHMEGLGLDNAQRRLLKRRKAKRKR